MNMIKQYKKKANLKSEKLYQYTKKKRIKKAKRKE